MTPLPVKIFGACLWNACCRRPKTTVLAAVLCLLLYVLFTHLKVSTEERIETVEEWEARMEAERISRLVKHVSFYVKPKDLESLPPSWTEENKCPACFGLDMCEAIEKNEVLIEIPKVSTEASKKGVYFGTYKDIPIAVKRMSSDTYPKEFSSFDRFVCSNVTGSESCDISAAILNKMNFIQQRKAFDPAFLIESWKISYASSGPTSLPYSLCLTDGLVKEFARLYGSMDNGNLRNLNPQQLALLFTSMAVQPESLILKFLKDKQFHKISPHIYGACGRLIVVEHGGVLLENYLNESFTERAELALQLLGLVNILWHTDPTWFALYKDFEYENVAVSYDKEIYLIDYEELVLIQGSTDELEDHDVFLKDKVCNEECFNKLWSDLSNPQLTFFERQTHCHNLHSVSSAYMHSRLCRNILSDLKEHREVADRYRKTYRGLLHGIPSSGENKDTESFINGALKECVHETTPGARAAAVARLSEFLFTFMKHLA